MHYFSLLFKKIKNPALHFRGFGRKTQSVREILRNFWKLLMTIQYKNWILLYSCENLLLKIEPSEITSFFYNNFSGSGVWNPPTPPPCVPLHTINFYKYSSKLLQKMQVNFLTLLKNGKSFIKIFEFFCRKLRYR